MASVCRLESIFCYLKKGCPLAAADSYYIESGACFGKVMLLEIMPGDLAELSLFGRCNSQLRGTESFCASGFHLHKDQNSSMVGDDVDFTERTKIIPA